MFRKVFALTILLLSVISGTTFCQSWTQVAHGAKLDTTWAGEVADIVLTSPGTYLAATATGLWRSSDGGSAWAPVDLGISSSYPQIFYTHPDGRIFCGTAIGGLFVSSDNGLTWNHLQGHPNQTICRMTKDSQGRLFTAVWPSSRSGGVFRSTDNGATWTKVLDTMYVEVVETGPGDVLFAGTGYNQNGRDIGGLWRSTDAGATWKAIYPAIGVRSVTVAADGSILMGGYSWNTASQLQLHTYRSTDNGATWTQCAGFYSEFYATDANHVVYTACDSGMRRSTNYGASWEALNTGLMNRKGAVPWLRCLRRIGESGFIAGEYYTSEIFRSSDLGAHWSASSVLQTSKFLPGKVVAIVPKSNGQLFLGSSAYGMLRWDAAQGLVRINTGLANQMVQAVYVGRTGDVFAGTAGGVYRSANNGANWTKFGSTTVGIRTMTDLASGELLAGTALGIIKFAPDGSTLAAMNTGLVNRSVNTFCTAPDGRIFVGTEDGLYRLDGTTWIPTAVTSRTLNVVDIKGAATTLALATRDSGIYVSANNGELWQPMRAGIEGIAVRALAVVAPDKLFAATEQHGVYTTTAGGGAWTPCAQGLNDLNIRGITLCPDGCMYSVTDSGAVFKTTSRVTGVVVAGSIAPPAFALGQNYPNPCNPTTTIGFQIPKRSFVRLKIVDLLGRDVATLVNDVREPGAHAVHWNASGVPSGVYFYQLHAGEYFSTRGMLVLK